MRRRLAELLTYLDATRTQLVATATQVNPAFAFVRPKSGAWSPAEVMVHLAMVESGVARLIARSVDWARSHGIGPEESDESIMSSLDEFGMVERAHPMTAPAMVTPKEEATIEKSLASLAQSRASLREALIAGADLDLAVVKRPHAVMGDLNLYQWALFVAQHEERHRQQIERTMKEVTGLAAESAPMV